MTFFDSQWKMIAVPPFESEWYSPRVCQVHFQAGRRQCPLLCPGTALVPPVVRVPSRVRDRHPRVLAPTNEPGWLAVLAYSFDPHTPFLVEHGRHCPQPVFQLSVLNHHHSQPSSRTRTSPASSHHSISPSSRNTSTSVIPCEGNPNHPGRRNPENMASGEDQLPPKQRLPRMFRTCVGNDTKVSMTISPCSWGGQGT